MSSTTLEGPRVEAHEHHEGTVTKAIETYTSQVPSGAYLGLAIGSIGLSLFLKLNGRDRDAQFVGQWVSPFLLLGLYNKVVKLHGSD